MLPMDGNTWPNGALLHLPYPGPGRSGGGHGPPYPGTGPPLPPPAGAGELLTLVLLFFLVYPLTLNWWEILRTLWQHAPAAFLLYLILFLWITGFSLARARHYRCLCRQLEAGQSLDHRDPLASPGPPVSAGQRPAPGAAGGLPGSRHQAGLMRDYSSRLIFWMAFFSRREIWAWEIQVLSHSIGQSFNLSNTYL